MGSIIIILIKKIINWAFGDHNSYMALIIQ